MSAHPVRGHGGRQRAGGRLRLGHTRVHVGGGAVPADRTRRPAGQLRLSRIARDVAARRGLRLLRPSPRRWRISWRAPVPIPAQLRPRRPAVARVSRTRLDELVLSRGLAPSRSAARALIMAGLVLVEGQVSDKAGTPTDVEADVTLKERPRFVSRAGDKLDDALDTFGVDVDGRLRPRRGRLNGWFRRLRPAAGSPAGHRPGRGEGPARRETAGRSAGPRHRGGQRALPGAGGAALASRTC